jgi:hypothetical protein
MNKRKNATKLIGLQKQLAIFKPHKLNKNPNTMRDFIHETANKIFIEFDKF